MTNEGKEQLLDDVLNELREHKEFVTYSKVTGEPPRQDVSQYSIRCVKMDRIEEIFRRFHHKLDDYE